MKWNWHVMNFATAADMLPVGSISKKIVSRKSHKIWKMMALPYISKYSYISRWLGSYIYYHLPPPWWIAKRNIKIMGGFGSYMLALACKKKVCVEEREVKGSQFVTQCHVKITPLIYFHLLSLGTMLLCLRLCRWSFLLFNYLNVITWFCSVTWFFRGGIPILYMQVLPM